MRAAVFQGPGLPLKLETLPDPVPGEGELVLKVERCGICGTDIHYTSGEGWQYDPGMIPGHEYAGTVVAVGPGVTDFRVGDHVSPMPLRGCGRCASCNDGRPQFCSKRDVNGGGFAELALASTKSCILLPPTLSMDDAALIEPMAVGYHAVSMSGLKAGANVLVLGAGPIGLGAVYWARQMKAGKIAVSARSRTREQYALAMGADVFLDPQRPLEEAVTEALGDRPAIVFEALGVKGGLGKAIDIVRHRGEIVAMGFLTEPDSIVPAVAVDKEVRIQFSMTYSRAEFDAVARALAKSVSPRSMVTATIPLSEIPEFFAEMHRKNLHAKVIIDTTA